MLACMSEKDRPTGRRAGWARALVVMLAAGLFSTAATGATAWAQLGSTRLSVRIVPVLVIEPSAAALASLRDPSAGGPVLHTSRVPAARPGASRPEGTLRWFGPPGHVQMRVDASGALVFESI